MSLIRRTTLRRWLALRLLLVAVVIFASAFALLMLYYQPRIAEESRAELVARAASYVSRSEAILAVLQGELELLAAAQAGSDQRHRDRLPDRVVREGGFAAIYQINAAGTVIRAAVLPAPGRKTPAELIGSNLANDRLRDSVMQRLGTVWSGKYLSPVSQRIAIAVGVWTGDEVIIGEIPIEFILRTITAAAGHSADQAIWVTDAYGEILADSESSARVGVVSLANQAFFKAADGLPAQISFEGTGYDVASARSLRLGWSFIARSPNGAKSPKLRAALELQLITLGISLLVFLLLTPAIAQAIARPIAEASRRAREVADGRRNIVWPESDTLEMRELATSLQTMATAQEERRQEIEALFDASPVGVAVLDPGAEHRIIKTNLALTRLFGYSTEAMLGRNGTELQLWPDLKARHTFYEALQERGQMVAEALLRRHDGSLLNALISARAVTINGQSFHLWAVHDVTEMRRIEARIRQLNDELEQRVDERTRQLQTANAELSSTIERLNLTRQELVRSEKLASLGSLVAGVAHELNTPIGNGVMAVSTLRGALRAFRDNLAGGLKRSVLDSFVDTVDTGTNIAERNLQRAAELISSFKQVAVDQTSSQRRRFALAEVIGEIALTLHPTLRHSVAELTVEVAPEISMESYPGPLGQILTNLINNATCHAFPERSHGSIRVTAHAAGERVLLEVADDGVGITADLLPRIFDPFVTSKMGRGGTGLGLNIAHNLAAQVLGGDIRVASTPGVGTTFTLDLPLVAPRSPDPA